MRLLLVVLVACAPPMRLYSLDELPVEEHTAGLPVRGDGWLVVVLPRTEDWSRARGGFDFSCDGCTIGDDRTKAALGDFFGDVDFGHLTVATARARATLRDGALRFTARVHSPEVTLDADVDGVLAPHIGDSELAGCIRFAPHDALRERDPRMHALLTVTGAAFDEGWHYIRVSGTVGEPRLLAERCTL